MKLRLFGLLALATIILSSFYFLDADKGKKSPENVTRAFYEAIGNKDFEAARRYGTPKTNIFLGTMERLMEDVPEQEMEEMPDIERVECTSLHKRIENCSPCCDENGEVAEEGVYLVKIKGDWKVHMTKETNQGNKEIEDYDAFIASAKEVPQSPKIKLGKVENTPESVAIAFSKCMAAGALEQAQEFATEEGKESLSTLSSITVLMSDEELKESFPGPDGVEKASCMEEEGGLVRCEVCCQQSEMSGDELLLVKEDGQWKVDFHKEGTPPRGDTPVEAPPAPKMDDE